MRSWWARTVVTAAEESAYDPGDWTKGTGLARRGAVAEITVDAGSAVAAVVAGEDPVTVEISVPVLDDDEAQTLAEVVAGASGWVGSLLAGRVPPQLDEALEESGVELLPYGGVQASCTCEAWVDPCPHALAVLVQVAWWVEDDPLVLLRLRGMDRSGLVDRVASTVQPTPSGEAAGDDGGEWPAPDTDEEVAVEAAERVAAWLEQERWAPTS